MEVYSCSVMIVVPSVPGATTEDDSFIGRMVRLERKWCHPFGAGLLL